MPRTAPNSYPPFKILFNVIEPLPSKDYLGSSLTKHTSQLSYLQLLFSLLLKSLEQPAIPEHHVHTAQGGAEAETRVCE